MKLGGRRGFIGPCTALSLAPLLAACAYTLAGCVSLSVVGSSNRIREAKQALHDREIERADYFRLVIPIEADRGRQSFARARYVMARSSRNEHLLDPPIHARLYAELDQALEKKEISEAEHYELRGLVRALHAEWTQRRRKVNKDRFHWGFPR